MDLEEFLSKYADCPHPHSDKTDWCDVCGAMIDVSGKAPGGMMQPQIIDDIRTWSTHRQEVKRISEKWHNIKGLIDDNFGKLSQEDQAEIIRIHPSEFMRVGHWYTTDYDVPVPRMFGGKPLS